MTALTGIVFSLAYGELDKSITPACFQSASKNFAGCCSVKSKESKFALFGLAYEIADGTAEAATEAINLRRDNLRFMAAVPS